MPIDISVSAANRVNSFAFFDFVDEEREIEKEGERVHCLGPDNILSGRASAECTQRLTSIATGS